MEKKFYSDNFEQLLKESTDNFRMYPSKRVWHSIYNDLHPSRKWPSLAVWLLLISSIVFIGLSNRNQVLITGNNSQISASATKGSNTILIPENSTTTDHITLVQKQVSLQNLNNTDSRTDNKIIDVSYNQKGNNHQVTGLTALIDKTALNPTKSDVINVADVNDKDLSALTVTTGINAELQKQGIPQTEISSFINNEKEVTDINLITNLIIKNKKAETDKKLSQANKSNKITDKEWIEDYAFHNKPSVSKWKTHVTYQLYFTPSVGFRVLSKNTKFNPVTSSLVASAGNVQDYKEALSQAAAVNVEIGGNILYSISKKLNLKAGIQLNYTNYGINAYELKHPTMTTLMLNDLDNGLPTLEPRSTTLANISGVSSKRLNNNTYQISVPLGADLRLAGRNNLKWYAGATIQPTYIAGGHSYLISSDLKNYITDKSLMNNWNLNAAVETFVSYKTKGGIIINAGPQFRYQLLSTYSKQYTYTEKLYNLGLKIGIITRF